MRILKEEKGSITLFVLIAMLFFVMYLVGMYILSANAESSGMAQTEQIKQIYEQDINNIDDVYATVVKKNTKYLYDIAKPGDYVKYKPTAKEFSMTPEQTGQDMQQKFNTGNYTGLWQVLYNDAEHGLQIISSDIVDNLTLGNKNNVTKTKLGYNNAIDTLNSFCFNYVDTKYATKGRSVGSNSISAVDETKETFAFQFLCNGSTESGCKIGDTNYSADYEAMKSATNQNANGIYSIGKEYWIASRNVYSDLSYADMGLKCVR